MRWVISLSRVLESEIFKTDEVKELEVAGIFYAIGHTPNTQPFKGQIDLDETGYIKVKPGTQETNIEGRICRWRRA